jgi:uncharacterized protein DUF4838
MIKKYGIILGLVMIFTAGVCVQADNEAITVDYVTNGGFEDKLLQNGKLTGWQCPHGKVSLSTDANKGKQALAVKDGYIVATQKFHISRLAGKKVTLSFYAKGTAGTKFGVMAFWWNGKRYLPSRLTWNRPLSKDKFTLFSRAVTIPKYCEGKFFFSIYNTAKKGTVTLDNVSLTGVETRSVTAKFSSSKAGLVIVKDGKSYAEIIIPKQASNIIRNSADLLAEYIYKSCGVKVNISEENSIDPNTAHIYLGKTKFSKYHEITGKGLGKQGFIIAFPNERSMVIAGQTDDAVEFGVYELLERYLGVRWLFPGELGEYVPAKKELVLKRNKIKQKPAFLSRLVSGLPPQGGKLWGRRNRMLGTMTFHHNLGKLFNPKKYTRTHPHFYPVINGKRRIPTTLVGWQPCFTAKGSVDEAAKNIISSFKRNPARTSFSLGGNDNSGFCECAGCSALDGNKINSVGSPSRSESYYRWCNAVVEKVLAEYPDKYFGLLAYNDVIDPMKKNKLNSHIVPYLCYDRMIWLNKDNELKGKELNNRWAEKISKLGWYDYIYGCKFYIIPRVYFHQMAENLRYGYNNKLRYYYAEAYPTADWREGPKLYILLKLLWNPNQDVDKLLKEWCELAVGKKAAGSLLAYYSLWENFWTQRIPKTQWFQKNRHGTFLPFRGYGYLTALTTKDMTTAEQLLRNTVNTAETKQEKARAQFFLKGFLKNKQTISQYKKFLALNKPAGKYTVKQVVDKSNFDKSTDNWGAWQRSYSKGILAYDRKEGHAKPGCLKFGMEKSVKSPLVFSKNMPIAEGKLYRWSAWTKHYGLLKSADIKLTLKWKDKNGKWFINRKDGKDIRPLNMSADTSLKDEVWRKTEIIFKAPPGGAVYAVCMLVVSSSDKGTVYIDDVVFEEIVAK